MRLPSWLLHFLPVWECKRCGYVFKKEENQCLTCIKCGGKRRPPSKDTIENAVLQIFSKFANIKFIPLKTHKERSEFAHHILAPNLKTKQRQALFIFFTEYLNSGWEDSEGTDIYDDEKWDGSQSSGVTLSVVTDPVKHGNYAFQVAGLGNQNEYGLVYKGISGHEYYARNYYLWKDSLPEASGNLWILSPAYVQNLPYYGVAFPVYDFDNSKFGIRYYGPSGYVNVFESGTTSVSADTWYCIELYLNHDDSGTITLWVDDVQKATVSDDTNQRDLLNIAAGNIFMYAGESSDKTIVIDCFILADARIYCEGELVEVADSVGLSDAALRDKTFAISDSVGLSDVPLKGWTPQVSDSVGLIGVVLRDKMFAVTDAVILAEALLADKQLVVIDAVGLADLVDVITEAIVKYVSDSLGLSDVALVDKPAVVADVVGVLDAVFRHKPVLLVEDVVSVVEAVLTSKLLMISDSVALADLVAKFGESVVFTISSRGFRQIAIVSEDFRQINVASKPFKQINISSRDLEVNAS